ncbi:hypothetical protein STRAU_5765 [Streptomyces aurantiacus JA 4570]|uniref:Uncharacterized protein n=1 Tax=Streptomyces aurantiacus JA 4570 TaxID=1286094 RepID=S3ZDD9_9ACTN|nr:hypothetical protein STRAU_5765 [Streptomyces aurantiacus JA 4570]
MLDTTHYGIVRQPQVRAVADAVNAESLPVPPPLRTTSRGPA